MKQPEVIISIPKEKGSYLLLMKLAESTKPGIPHLQDFVFPVGYYLYIGSAHGPGGLNARVGRHIRKEKKVHWHIDHLTKVAPVYCTILITVPVKLESSMTEYLMKTSLNPVPGFGCGDSYDFTHLFYDEKKKNFDLTVSSFTDYLLTTFPTQIWRFDV